MNLNNRDLVLKVVELEAQIEEAQRAAAELDTLRPRLARILAPFEGQVLEAYVEHGWRHFLVLGGQLVRYHRPPVFHTMDLDEEPASPEAVTAAATAPAAPAAATVPAAPAVLPKWHLEFLAGLGKPAGHFTQHSAAANGKCTSKAQPA